MEKLNIEQIIPKQENKESLISKYLKTISELRKQKSNIAEQIKKTENNIERQILETDLEDTQKRIEEYEISINKYRNTVKNNHLRNIAGEESVAEVIDFKKSKKQKNSAEKNEKNLNSEVGKKFLSNFNNFKKRKQHG